ncbi:MAG: lysophospholipid acyltransferase family protein [Vicinamibacterales bacterium]
MTVSARSAEGHSLFRPARTGREQVPRRRPIAGWSGAVALRAVSLLPLPLIHQVGGMLGAMAASLPIKPARFAAVTLGLCFPELSPRERRALLRRSLAESGRTLCELGALWTWRRERVLGLIRDISGEEHLRAALDERRGVILAAPHLGAWELGALYCSAAHPFTALYKRRTVTALDRFIARGRSRFGARLVPANAAGIRTLVRELAEGRLVGIMPDQDPRRGAGVFAPFFGVLANTTTLVSRLARRTGAPVMVAFAERLPRGAGYRLHFSPASPAICDPDPAAAAAALNQDIERLVRRRPDQYLWSYKRFRVRPDGDANPYRPQAHADSGRR